MANATAVVVKAGAQSFRGVFAELFSVTALMNVGNLVDAAGETNTVAVPGVLLGDVVIATSLNVDIAGFTVTAYVSAADVVSVRVQNESGSPLDLAEKTLKLVIVRLV